MGGELTLGVDSGAFDPAFDAQDIEGIGLAKHVGIEIPPVSRIGGEIEVEREEMTMDDRAEHCQAVSHERNRGLAGEAPSFLTNGLVGMAVRGCEIDKAHGSRSSI